MNQTESRPLSLWVDNATDLTHLPPVTTLASLPPDLFSLSAWPRPLLRPRRPLAAGKALPKGLPPVLHELYRVAAQDLRAHGFVPEQLYVYVLYHADHVPCGSALREPQWHFDLSRLQCVARGTQRPVAISYSVTNILPTEFALSPDMVWQAQPYEVVRYDTLTLHRGQRNNSGAPVSRIFAHLAFSPIPA